MSLEANTREALSDLMVINNRINDKEFDYYFFQKTANKWICWFRADLSIGYLKPGAKEKVTKERDAFKERNQR